jgi:hypothetical protein
LGLKRFSSFRKVCSRYDNEFEHGEFGGHSLYEFMNFSCGGIHHSQMVGDVKKNKNKFYFLMA